MFYTQIEDLYDLSTELKQVYNQLVDTNKHLKSKAIYGAIGKFNKALTELDLVCESQGICPYCGHDINFFSGLDENGYSVFRKCSSCGKEF